MRFPAAALLILLALKAWAVGPPPLPGDGDGLAAARDFYLGIVRGGGWVRLPGGLRLSAGDRGEDVARLRMRLLQEGYRPETALCEEAATFGPCLEEMLVRFQRSHGLPADGVLGPLSLRALNVSARSRLRTIEANLRRSTGAGAPPERRVEVNIPDFRLVLYEEGRPVLESRVIVGRPGRPTPELSSRLSTVVLHPSWTVPDRIAREEILPRLRRDPGLAERIGLSLVTAGASPLPLPPQRIFGERGTDAFVLRQAPGPQNPMGHLKILFPNRAGIDLHATPETGDFERPVRALSHGCVRVERITELVSRILPAPAWIGDEVWSARWLGREIEIGIPDPPPLRIVYRTAWVDPEDGLQFRPDIYGRDRPVPGKNTPVPPGEASVIPPPPHPAGAAPAHGMSPWPARDGT